ncbi:MAG TPA: hypothetical protein VF792_07810 [Ktedonobacterales bacterium]
MPGDYPPRGSGGSWQSRPDSRSGSRGASASGARWQQGPEAGAPSVYRPYDPNAGGGRGPRRVPGAAPWNADPLAASGIGAVSSVHVEAVRRRRDGFAIFHDGNAGHLWRGEFMSLLGESALSVGLIIWLAGLTRSPLVILGALLALGIPWLLVGPLGAVFENVKEPARLLTWLGRLRMAAALALIPMHFLTIYPLLYILIFTISISGRLRQALRVAAMRTCLAHGEIELVANDLYVASSFASVVGPLFGAMLYLLLGDRVILLAIGAALLFLFSANSDGALDALPEEQRAYLQAQPSAVAPDEATRDDLIRAALDEDGEGVDDPSAEALSPEQRELALPEWYQAGPTQATEAMADIRAGVGLAGARKQSASAMLTLLALALVGGGLSALEVFFIVQRLNLAPIYFGVVASLEAGGMVLGAYFANARGPAKKPARQMLTGLMLTGIALVLFALSPLWMISFAAALGMGIANAIAVTGARQALRTGRDGVERRAISAAENAYSAFASLLGAALFTGFYVGSSRLHVGSHTFTPLSLTLIFVVAGLGLALYSFALRWRPGVKDYDPVDDMPIHTKARLAKIAQATNTGAAVGKGGLWADGEDDGDADEYEDEEGYTGEYDAEYEDDWDDAPPPPPRGGSSRRR